MLYRLEPTVPSLSLLEVVEMLLALSLCLVSRCLPSLLQAASHCLVTAVLVSTLSRLVMYCLLVRVEELRGFKVVPKRLQAAALPSQHSPSQASLFLALRSPVSLYLH
ncbi:hypothetical protein FB192DRAFT_1371604 [Mucor lusitanicus]|uniref:Uncharacterized protein n=1 Tax=Mucor circinelloides f. lusitanicus TaxID=29924 RepID=A0A8H4F441_MUCCL|nr:hypothetical protein FB192DRAFT_1371604 [Mucor lusitanicus]